MKNNETPKTEYTAVALGNFDGVHIGHRQVLLNAKTYSLDNNVKAVALVFDKHPKSLSPQRVGLLMTEDDKQSEIDKMGIACEILRFADIKDYSAEKFVSEILVKKLHAKAVFCGYNYHFSKGGNADTEVLKKLCRENSIEVFVSDKVEFEGETVSSSYLRKLLSDGDVERVNKLMMRAFSYSLEVVHGQKRGREMGFPTLNQYFPPELVIPKFGVYASIAEIDAKDYLSFTNIGSRPTFPEDDVRSETHVFDFDGDLYGKEVRVKLYKFIRSEIKFTSLDELVSQLEKDKITAEKYFEESGENLCF